MWRYRDLTSTVANIVFAGSVVSSNRGAVLAVAFH
jgi:hypothetical protein